MPGSQMDNVPSTVSSEVALQSASSTGRQYLHQVLQRRGTWHDKELRVRATQLKVLLSFGDSEHLLRGSPIANVISHVGVLLSGAAGSAQTYDLSARAAGSLAAFISHNWSVGRIRKFLALALEFNFDLASGATLLILVPLAICVVLRAVPFDPHAVDNPGVSSFLARCTTGPVFLIALVFVRDFWCLRGSGPVVFFDKTCIHQTDGTKKSEGIGKLGAFLAKSDRMVVLYTPVYLNKLWTVYELACYLSLYEAERLKFVPLAQSALYFLGIFAVWVWTFSVGVAHYIGASQVAAYVLAFFIFLGYAVAQRIWAREKIAIVDRLRTFNVRDTICAVESDRHLVYKNIKALMEVLMDLPDGVELDLSLDAFNTLVRADLPDVVAASLGTFAFKYTQYVMLGVVAPGSKMIDALENFGDGTPITLATAYEAHLLIWVLVIYPAALAAIELLCSKKLHLHGGLELLFVVTMLLTVVCISSAVDLALKRWHEASAHSNLAFVTFVCTAVALYALAALVGNGLVSRRREPHLSAAPRMDVRGDCDEGGLVVGKQAEALAGETTPGGECHIETEEDHSSVVISLEGFCQPIRVQTLNV